MDRMVGSSTFSSPSPLFPQNSWSPKLNSLSRSDAYLTNSYTPFSLDPFCLERFLTCQISASSSAPRRHPRRFRRSGHAGRAARGAPLHGAGPWCGVGTAYGVESTCWWVPGDRSLLFRILVDDYFYCCFGLDLGPRLRQAIQQSKDEGPRKRSNQVKGVMWLVTFGWILQPLWPGDADWTVQGSVSGGLMGQGAANIREN